MTVPLPGMPLHEHRTRYEELAALGYTDVWSAEATTTDGFTPLALAAAWVPTLRLGVAIAPVFTRGPALLAQTTASLADAAPGLAGELDVLRQVHVGIRLFVRRRISGFEVERPLDGRDYILRVRYGEQDR